MARVAKERTTVPLAPEAALALWTDTVRWPTFIEGFAHVIEQAPSWPQSGSRVVWQSVQGGRGRVTETVQENSVAHFTTEVFEEALNGRQTVSFGEDADGALVELQLEYELNKRGPLTRLADWIFIRRALQQSLGRTLRRFSAEAEEEASL